MTGNLGEEPGDFCAERGFAQATRTAPQFCDPQIAAEAPTLERFDFLVCRPFAPPRRGRLKLA
jgi:hypothetical protein